MINSISVHNRFWSKVDKRSDNECWNWTAAYSGKGYGRFKIKGKFYLPHRLVYESIHGTVPKNIDICHKCDNPSCVNPKHLFAGTRSDNMKDCASKGRISKNFSVRRGSEANSSKLTELEVAKIKCVYSTTNATLQNIAEVYGVNKTTIGRIIRGEAWKHVA